ncbi:MAG: DUF5990 family protein [Gammaproteobacteria bacterium]
MAPTDFKSLRVRLLCNTMPAIPPSEGKLDVGIQDKAQAVYAGQKQKDGSMFFECALEASRDESTGKPNFRGPFVHGTPEARFLYLSWKRNGVGSSPWYWRVKVPLSGITWKEVSLAKSNELLEADITGRRPHATDPIPWRRTRAGAV